MSAEERRAIMAELPSRESAHAKRRGGRAARVTGRGAHRTVRLTLGAFGPAGTPPTFAHLHGELRLELGGRAAPRTGYFGPADLCLNDWVRELRAVLGHELGHVKNRDILTSSIVATLAGAIGMLAWMSLFFRGKGGYGALIGLAAFLLAPLAAGLIQAGISRTREYQADRTGAELTQDPEGLASALEKLHAGVAARPLEQTPMAQSTAHLYIVHSFRGGGMANLFSTHPPLEERVRRLRSKEFRSL